MSSQLGPLEFTCDAPPYLVIQACQRLGFQTPLDVRWCRLSQFLLADDERAALHGYHAFDWLVGKELSSAPHCSCGEPLPVLEGYTFTFLSGKSTDYHMGQCRRCRTMFWEEG